MMKLSILTIATLLVSAISVSASVSSAANPLECHLGNTWDLLQFRTAKEKDAKGALLKHHFSEELIKANLQNPDCVANMDPSILAQQDATKPGEFIDLMVKANTLASVPSACVQGLANSAKVCEHIRTNANTVMPAITPGMVGELPLPCIIESSSGKNVLNEMSLDQIDKLSDDVLKSPLRHTLLKDRRFASRLTTDKLKKMIGEGFEECGRLDAQDLLNFPKTVLGDLPSSCVSEIKDWTKKGTGSTLGEIDYLTLAGNLSDSAFELWTLEFKTAGGNAILPYLRDAQIKNLDAKTTQYRCSNVDLSTLPAYLAKNIAPDCAAGYFASLPTTSTTAIKSLFFTYAPDELFSKVESVDFLGKIAAASSDVHPFSTFHAAHWEDLLKKDLETTCRAITKDAAEKVLATFPPSTDPQCFAYMEENALTAVLGTIINVLPDNALSKLTYANPLATNVLEQIADAKASLLSALGAEFSGPGNFCARYKLDDIKALSRSIPHLHKNCITSIQGIDAITLADIGDYPEDVQKAIGIEAMVADLDTDYFKKSTTLANVLKHPSICAALKFPQFSAIDDKFITDKRLTAKCLSAFTFAAQLTPKQISIIPPETLSTVDGKFLAKIDIAALTVKQLESLGANAVGLGPDAVAKLPAAKLAALKAAALGALPPATFGQFTDEKWKAINPVSLTMVDKERFAKLPETVVLVTTKAQAEKLGMSIDAAKRPVVGKALHARLPADVQQVLKIDESAPVTPAAPATPVTPATPST